MKAPEHLTPQSRRWWLSVVRDYSLEPHHVRLLTFAAEAWDRAEQARKALKENGLTFEDRFGQPRARPEVAVERDSALRYARILREIDLDIETPAASRPPRLLRYGNAR